jgi:hypothetical protein
MVHAGLRISAEENFSEGAKTNVTLLISSFAGHVWYDGQLKRVSGTPRRRMGLERWGTDTR